MTTTTDPSVEPEILPADAPLPTPAEDGPNLADLGRAVAIADAVEKHLKDKVQDTRDEVLHQLNDLRLSTGIKQMDVLLDPTDPESKVATISLTGGEAKIVISNESLYTAWVEAHYPGEVEYRATVRDSFAKAHLAGLVTDGAIAYDPKFHELDDDGATAGGIVDGVRLIPATEPTSIRLTFARETKKQPNGRAKVISTLTGQSLAQLLGASAPVIDGEG